LLLLLLLPGSVLDPLALQLLECESTVHRHGTCATTALLQHRTRAPQAASRNDNI
jgi:hypothetical protein